MDQQTLKIVVAALVVVLLGLTAWALWRDQRRRTLKRKYGPEYERLAGDKGDADRAVRELEARERRVSAFKLRDLTPAQREHDLSRWREIQAAFVDEPVRATQDAHALLMDVMRDRGYPEADLDQRQRDLSVDYPALIEPYREACAIAARRAGTASTEDLRRATIVYRSLLEALLDGRNGGRPMTRQEVADARASAHH
jgi:hypothetical protein